MTLEELEVEFRSIEEAHKAGEISQEEYINLLQAIDTSKAIGEAAEDLEKKSDLNKLINAAITAASLV